jgi:hypothetical protein
MPAAPAVQARGDMRYPTMRLGRLSVASFALLAAATSCTTTLRPVKCQGKPYACNEYTDIMFCEYEAIAIEGADCADLGLAPAKHFCVVTSSRCADNTNYDVDDKFDCKILQYRTLLQAGECSPGTPTFVHP